MNPPAAPFEGLRRGHYGAIVADPPWRFATWSETRQTRAASNHYALMSLDEIKRLPVVEIAAPDCALFLWCINPMLPQALEVMDAWGFKFKTVAFTWAKKTKNDSWHMGLGYWTRQNTEMCLLGTQGKPMRLARDVRQLVVSPRQEHSRKPASVCVQIERLVAGPYVELFSRQRRSNWHCWGNQTERFDIAT